MLCIFALAEQKTSATGGVGAVVARDAVGAVDVAAIDGDVVEGDLDPAGEVGVPIRGVHRGKARRGS